VSDRLTTLKYKSCCISEGSMTDMAFSHYKVVMSKFSSGTQRNDTCMNESM